MNEETKQFEPVAAPVEGQTVFFLGEVIDVKGRAMRVVRVTKHCLVLSPVGWNEVDVGESVPVKKDRGRRNEEKRLRKVERRW